MKSIFILLSLMLAASCQTGQVLSDFDPAANFSSYRTFSVCLDDFQIDSPEHAIYHSPGLKASFKEAIESELGEYYTINDLTPDLKAGVKIKVQDKSFTYRSCDREEEYRTWPECKLKTYEYSEGTVLVYVADKARNQIIWQASVTGITDENAAGNKKVIQRIVHDLFQSFPLKTPPETVMKTFSEN